MRMEFDELKKDMLKKKDKMQTVAMAAEPEAPEDDAVKEYKQQKVQFEEKKKDLPKRGLCSLCWYVVSRVFLGVAHSLSCAWRSSCLYIFSSSLRRATYCLKGT